MLPMLTVEQMEIRSMRIVKIVNLPLTPGRARKGFKPRVWGERGFKAISRVAQTHLSGCVITAMFRSAGDRRHRRQKIRTQPHLFFVTPHPCSGRIRVESASSDPLAWREKRAARTGKNYLNSP